MCNATEENQLTVSIKRLLCEFNLYMSKIRTKIMITTKRT